MSIVGGGGGLLILNVSLYMPKLISVSLLFRIS